MLLTGTHPRTLDEKNRLVLPKRIREQLRNPDKLYITPGPDQCLWAYTGAELDKLSERLDQTPATDAEGRVFRRLFFADTEEADVDGNGRVLIPERLTQFAGLQHDVVLIGVRDHLELWDKARWQAYLSQHAPRFDSVAEQAFRK
jgi:MraZ protein